MSFSEKYRKFATAYKNDWDTMSEKEKEDFASGVLGLLIILGILAVFLVVIVSLLAIFIGKLIPVIIGAAVVGGAYMLYKKLK